MEVIMVFRIIAIVLMVVILQMPVLGQIKVGAIGHKFLEISPSVRSNGMGETGVALIDNSSMYFNPASLGLVHENNRGQGTFYSVKVYLPTKFSYDYRSLSARLIQGDFYRGWQFTVGLGYYFTRLKSDSIPVTTYAYPSGTGDYIQAVDRAHNVPIAVGLTGRLDIGLGLNIKYIKEEIGQDKADGFAFDLGVLVRLPSDKIFFPAQQNNNLRPFFSPSIGFSLCNIGPDFEMALQDSPLPQFRRLGGAASFGLDLKSGGNYLNLFRITPAFDIRDYPVYDPEIMYGVEIYLMDAVAGRLGKIDDNTSEYNTHGGGIRSRGIVRLFTDVIFPRPSDSNKGLIRFFRDDLNIEFSYARKKCLSTTRAWVPRPSDFYNISVSL